MPLDEYHRKRDFEKTPEPRGDARARTSGFSFCVHHPLEYGGFEGVIPSGAYGGGTVLHGG